MEGYIWYNKEFFGGKKEDYEAFCMAHEDTKFIMKYFATSTKQLSEIANNLNNSNVARELKHA
ncbi:hypothetical protein [Marinoscillum furvescens]|uniref:Uncharacterized protein n=1 Tax=Marinoscillum furvescens DSM 4134 TaxID=1122208 RepID=A0A3D9KWK2_MARFU|nr:hypothetical protein [Marinoscillum furvescens]RED92653.1 hypothetical protein C7460_12940 [Marinoscillum furvescens DSM 4134]